MQVVPYPGQPPAILDLIANRLHFNISSIGLVADHINTGALKPLAVLGTTRSALLPNVPTVSEAGYAEINVVPWYGYAVPRGTPQPVVDRIAAGLIEALKTPRVRELLQRQGLEPVQPMSLADVTALYAADAGKYAKVIHETGMKRAE